MTAEQNIALYRWWLDEVWSKGDYAAAEEIIAENLLDHTPMAGQPTGRAGDVWALRGHPRDARAAQARSTAELRHEGIGAA
jgi:hypothetical protein